eukprot:12370943-Heterocapsa_arctica.AAC.1
MEHSRQPDARGRRSLYCRTGSMGARCKVPPGAFGSLHRGAEEAGGQGKTGRVEELGQPGS